MGSKRKRGAQDASSAAPAAKKHQNKSKNAITKTATSPPPLDSSPFEDNPKGVLNPRESQLYELLSSENSAERLNAANAIVSGLLGGDGVPELTLQRHLQRNLFRGLASGRKGARLGRGVVLTEILRQLFGTEKLVQKKYPGLTFDKVLGFLLAGTKPEGDTSGQEEKDHFLGLLFGLQSFVRAKIISEESEAWNTILEKLLELAKKKPWIREECGWVIMEALPQMNQTQAEYTLDKLYDEGLAITPEGVGIWITAKDRFPNMKFSSKPWGKTGNPLDRLQTLAKALKESSSNDDGETKIQQAKHSGVWNPQLHFVWSTVLARFANTQKTKEGGVLSEFENFWKVAVDENLFSGTASSERKFWGFLLFQKVLQDPGSYFKFFPSIFSRNLVRCLINQIQEKDRFLNRAADKSLKVLLQTVEAHPYTLPTILSRLIGGYGSYNFDRVTKTKTIDQLLSRINETTVKEVIDTLRDPALNVERMDTSDEANMRRTLFGDYTLDIIRRLNATDEAQSSGWIGEAGLPMLANIAYTNTYACTPPLSEKTRVLFRDRLMSAFTHLLSDLKAFHYPCDLLQKFAPDAVAMDKDVTDAKDNALSIMKKLLKQAKKAEDRRKAPLQALALVYSLVIFQLYNGESDAISVLEELKLCYDKLIRHKDTDDSDVEASEVLVELLLSFISKPSALLRKVAQHVITAFMDVITAGGLKLMTDVLESSESLKGQQEMFDQEPENGEEMDVDEDEEMDSDVEVVDMDGEEGHLNGHLDEEEEEGEDSASESDDSSAEDDAEAEALNEELAKILGTQGLDKDAEAAEDSDADMTDSEMMALDAKLVEVFSQRKKAPNKKQEQKEARETMINFKSRVLDLLEIYAKKQATNPLAFGLLLPLLQLIRTTTTKALATKAHSIIQVFAKSFRRTKKADDPSSSSSPSTPPSKDLNIPAQLALLKAIHLEASKNPSHAFAKAASTASLLVASSLYNVDKATVAQIADVYRDTQVAWVQREVRIQAAFFIEWVNWCQSHAAA